MKRRLEFQLQLVCSLHESQLKLELQTLFRQNSGYFAGSALRFPFNPLFDLAFENLA